MQTTAMSAGTQAIGILSSKESVSNVKLTSANLAYLNGAYDHLAATEVEEEETQEEQTQDLSEIPKTILAHYGLDNLPKD